jgi:hypothetical protein
MASAIDDLWPADIAPTEGPVPPITILKQQASLLGKRTNNMVEGEVETKTEDFQRFLRHILYLVAPALNFYRYPLLEVEHHAASMYPATIKVVWLEKQGPEALLEIQTADEQAFKEGLRRVFADEETKKVIGALLAQSMEKQSQE